VLFCSSCNSHHGSTHIYCKGFIYISNVSLVSLSYQSYWSVGVPFQVLVRDHGRCVIKVVEGCGRAPSISA
jgi:hypothetical protein